CFPHRPRQHSRLREDPRFQLMHGEVLAKARVSGQALEVLLRPGTACGNVGNLVRIDRWSVQVEKPDSGDDVASGIAGEVELDFLADVSRIFVPAFEARDFDADGPSQARIEPALEELRHRQLLCVPFDEEHELHSMASNSPERNSAPRLYSSSQRASSSPSTTERRVSPSAQ